MSTDSPTPQENTKVCLSSEEYKKNREILLDYSGILEKRLKTLNTYNYLLLVVLIYGTITMVDNFDWGWLRKRHQILSDLIVHHDKNTKEDSFRINLDSTIEKKISFEPKKEFLYQESRKNLIDTKNLEQYKYMHDRMVQDALRLKAPILGFTFDINNFPLFLGITLLSLLYLISIQSQSIAQVKLKYKTHEHPEIMHYPHLSRLATLNGLAEASDSMALKKKLLVLTGAWATLVQLVTFIYSIKSWEKRHSVDPVLTCIYMGLEGLLLGVIIYWSWKNYKNFA